LSPKLRLMGKVSHSTLFQPFGPGGVNHPSATEELAKLREGDTLTPDLVFRDPYFLEQKEERS